MTSKRLLAFGCSLTYGHGLSDCFDKVTNGAGKSPSAFSWPALVAQKMDRTIVNLSNPGASNKEIWYRIVNTEFTADDLVFILWSHFDRHCVYSENDSIHQLAQWKVDSDKLTSNYYRYFHSSAEINYDFNLRVSHTNLYLKSKGIKVYNLVSHHEYTKFDWNTVDFLNTSIYDLRKAFPKALDGVHPGEEAHSSYAEKIIKEIGNIQ